MIQIDQHRQDLETFLQQVGISIEQAYRAAEAEVINECLILQRDRYNQSNFEERTDFKYVILWNLVEIPNKMFHKAANLVSAFGPKVKVVEDGQLIAVSPGQFTNIGAFTGTKLKQALFPQLERIGSYSFSGCKIQSLTVNCPLIAFVGDSAFEGCPITKINLQHLLEVGDLAFCECPISTLVAPRLISVGEYSFYNSLISKSDIKALTVAGDYCFQGCHFQSLELPNLIVAGEMSFAKCRLLQQFSAPQLQKLGENVFTDCESLCQLDCKLKRSKFVCRGTECETVKNCPICRGDLERCFMKGKIKGLICAARKLQETAIQMVRQTCKKKQDLEFEICGVQKQFDELGRGIGKLEV